MCPRTKPRKLPELNEASNAVSPPIISLPVQNAEFRQKYVSGLNSCDGCHFFLLWFLFCAA